MLGTEHYAAGVHTPGCVLMQPAALVRGLASALPENVELYEESPVIALDCGRHRSVTCPGGTVRASRLVLATNGYIREFGFFAKELFGLRTFASLTRPLDTAEIESLGGEGDWGIIAARSMGTTLRYTRDRRILIRNVVRYAPDGRWRPAELLAARREHLRLLRARFPMLPRLEFEHTWGGLLCLSRNFATAFGEVAPGVFAAACHNGIGTAMGTISGRLAAHLAVGEDHPLLADMLALPRPRRCPPDPLLGWLVSTRLAIHRLRAGRER